MANGLSARRSLRLPEPSRSLPAGTSVGNGLVAPEIQYQYYKDMVVSTNGYPAPPPLPSPSDKSDPSRTLLGPFSDPSRPRHKPAVGNLTHAAMQAATSATTPPYLRHIFSAISRPSLGHLSAISRLSLGYLSAISRPSLGYLSAISRLSLGYLSRVEREQVRLAGEGEGVRVVRVPPAAAEGALLARRRRGAALARGRGRGCVRKAPQPDGAAVERGDLGRGACGWAAAG